MSDVEPRNGRDSRSRSRSYTRSRSGSNARYASKSRSRSRTPPKRLRSRSRTPQKSRRQRSSRRSRSRSRSRSSSQYNKRRGGNDRRNSRSRSPMSRRRRHVGNREEPEPSRCLGIFGLSFVTEEREVEGVFEKYGEIESVNVVRDRQSGRSRGFAFIYFRNVDDAIEAKSRSDGLEVDGRRIRVDYSITQRAHTPTPGIYLGKPTNPGRNRRTPSPFYGGGSRRYRGLSPRYSRSRSRSRSHSPPRDRYRDREYRRR